MKKRIISFLLVSLLVLAGIPRAAAHPVPDPAAGGSVHVALKDGDKMLQGGSLTLYHVAQIRQEDGNFSFVLTPEFAASGLDLSDPQSEDLAQGLAAYAEKNQPAGVTCPVENGTVRYPVEPGKLGLYLVVQSEACKGYEPLKPFVIGIPVLEGAEYVYDVDAAPKMGKLIPRPEPEPGTEPATEPEPVPPTGPGEPELPQTGQLNWPIPVLAAAGLLLFAAGWILRRSDRKENRYA